MNSIKMTWNTVKSFGNLPLTVLMLALVVFSTSCGKDDDDDDTQTPNQPTATTIPPIDDADGIMVALKTIAFINQLGFETEVPTNTAVAAFGNMQTGDFVDVGAVDVDGNVLTKYENDSYVFTPSVTNPNGIEFGTNFTWNVAGGNGFAAFDHTVNMPFPSVGKITSATGTISSASPYTLSVQNVAGSDSVIFQIAGANGTNVLVTKVGNPSSHTFTAAEVASVGKGTAIIQVAAYRMDNATKGGKNIYFINETVVTEFVEFQ